VAHKSPVTFCPLSDLLLARDHRESHSSSSSSSSAFESGSLRGRRLPIARPEVSALCERVVNSSLRNKSNSYFPHGSDVRFAALIAIAVDTNRRQLAPRQLELGQ
jgi:hypothetical protein